MGDATSNRLESTSHDQRSSCVTAVQLKQTHEGNGKSRGSDREEGDRERA